jgi:hypothetical protein
VLKNAQNQKFLTADFRSFISFFRNLNVMIADDDTSKLWAPITPTIFVSIFPKCLIFDSPEQLTPFAASH